MGGQRCKLWSPILGISFCCFFGNPRKKELASGALERTSLYTWAWGPRARAGAQMLPRHSTSWDALRTRNGYRKLYLHWLGPFFKGIQGLPSWASSSLVGVEGMLGELCSLGADSVDACHPLFFGNAHQSSWIDSPLFIRSAGLLVAGVFVPVAPIELCCHWEAAGPNRDCALFETTAAEDRHSAWTQRSCQNSYVGPQAMESCRMSTISGTAFLSC